MRRPVLHRWLKRELLALSGITRFSLLSLASLAQGSNARLIAPLFLYCRETGCSSKLSGLIYRKDIASEYKSLDSLLAGKDLTQLALSGKADGLLPREYAKHLISFAADYRKEDTVTESKKCERIDAAFFSCRKGRARQASARH